MFFGRKIKKIWGSTIAPATIAIKHLSDPINIHIYKKISKSVPSSQRRKKISYTF